MKMMRRFFKVVTIMLAGIFVFSHFDLTAAMCTEITELTDDEIDSDIPAEKLAEILWQRFVDKAMKLDKPKNWFVDQLWYETYQPILYVDQDDLPMRYAISRDAPAGRFKIFPQKETAKNCFVGMYLNFLQRTADSLAPEDLNLCQKITIGMEGVENDFCDFIQKQGGETVATNVKSFLKSSYGHVFLQAFFIPCILLDADYENKFPQIASWLRSYLILWRDVLMPKQLAILSAENIGFVGVNNLAGFIFNQIIGEKVTELFPFFEGRIEFFETVGDIGQAADSELSNTYECFKCQFNDDCLSCLSQ
ncbi:MAG: hypothetical protein WCW33_00525 [Candidatus Babeliales bacterium]|jgi:hypothetical protein